MAISEIDTDLLITEVEKRPALWNCGIKEYTDKNVRKSMWEEIVMTFGGEPLDDEEKRQLGVQLQKKWKNLRDCYFREVRRLNDIKKGSAAKKRNIYVYFQPLHFLKVVTEMNLNESNIDRATEPKAKEAPPTKPSQTYRTPQIKKATADARPVNNSGLRPANNYKSSIRSRKEDERNDCDKLFLLSLLDDFKKIPECSKSTAKIEMLKLIQYYQHESDPEYYQQSEIYSNSRQTAHDDCSPPSRKRVYDCTTYPERQPILDISSESSVEQVVKFE